VPVSRGFRVAALAVLAGAFPAGLPAQRPDSVVMAPVRVPTADSAWPSGPGLPLDSVIVQTLLHSPTLAGASGLVRTAQSAQRVAVGAYLPGLTLNSSIIRSNQTLTGGAGQSGAQTGYGAGLLASVDLFTGGRRGAVSQETAALSRAADAGLLLERYATVLVAKAGYFEVLRGHELVRVADDALAVARTGLAYARARGTAGTATPSDVLRAELALSTAQRQGLAARDTLAAAAAALGRLVGSDGPADAEPSATLEPTPLLLADSLIVELAAREAPAVHQAEAQLLASRASVSAARSQYLPTISAGAGYDLANNAAVPGALRQGWVVEVGTSFPLFDGFRREDSVTRARVTADVAASVTLDTRRFSRSEAARLLGSLRVAEQDVALTTEAVRVATEDLRVISLRYRAGIATILDQLTSQANLVQAELDLVSARFTYQIARAALSALLGREL